MLKKLLYSFVLFLFFTCKKNKETIGNVDYRVHTFYYNWYANPEIDGEYAHWNHEILPHWSDTTWNNSGAFSGGNNIGANFFPTLGNYSSNDLKIISKHLELMKAAWIGVLAITWWGQNSFENHSISKYLDIAEKYGLKLTFHIEPFYKSAIEFKEQLSYLNTQYGDHPAIFKYNGKPFYYIYDSYKLRNDEWSKLLTINGQLSLRNTSLDGTFIGLWVHKNEGGFFINSGFDGFYTYFASDGFVYGSTTSNWEYLSKFAKKNHLIFIPCVGPGYIDTRIRPWNAANTKRRNNGIYYEEMFNSALEVNPDFIGITSFNEWHEGTQIEPAVPKSIPKYNYENYGEGIDPLFYIRKTKALINKYEK